MKAFSREQFDALVGVAEKHNPVDALMIRTAFYHGLRVSEVINLTAANFDNGILIVQRLKNSNKTAQAVNPADREALEKLAATGGRLFPIHRKTAWERIKRYGAEAGIPEHLCHPHTLKHTCGRLAYKGGLGVPEVACRLGHKNKGNSLVYMEPDEAEVSQAFAKAVSA